MSAAYQIDGLHKNDTDNANSNSEGFVDADGVKETLDDGTTNPEFMRKYN